MHSNIVKRDRNSRALGAIGQCILWRLVQLMDGDRGRKVELSQGVLKFIVATRRRCPSPVAMNGAWSAG